MVCLLQETALGMLFKYPVQCRHVRYSNRFLTKKKPFQKVTDKAGRVLRRNIYSNLIKITEEDVSVGETSGL